MLRLLGTPRWVLADGRELPLAVRDALLLALLALDGPQTRPRAAALLWPDSDPRHANLSLRQRIFRLKRTAGTDVIVGDGAIRLADAVRHDLSDLDEALHADAGHARGALLAGIEAPDADDELAAWLAAARARWHDALHQRLAALAEEHAAAGRLAQALPYAERLVTEAPAAEHAHRRLMRLHYLRGDRAAALEAGRRCVEALASEVGAEPGEETRALTALIERGDMLAADAPALAPAPLALLRPPRLVGRNGACQAIVEAWRGGRHLLVSGEPGIGKSRLLAEFAAQAGVPVIEVRPGDRAVPYGVLGRVVQAWRQRCGEPADRWAVQELARFAPGLGETPAGEAQTARVQAALQAWAAHAAAAGLTGTVLDDLQFCDAATLEALLTLLPQAEGPRWLLAVRAAERPPALDTWLAGPAGDGTGELALPPLDREGVAELLHSLDLPGVDAPGWLPLLWRQAGGSPFFTLQTLLACAPRPGEAVPPELPALPPHVGQLLERRLQRLSPRALQLAQVAALAETDFSVALAAAVLRCHALDLAPAWRELESAQVLRDGAYAHDLVREAALRLVPEAIARELHGQIAAALDPAQVPPVRMALHHEQAGQWAQAARRYREAAQAALVAGRRGEQARLLLAAAQAHAQAGQRRERVDALADRIGALVQAGGGDELRAALAELAPLAGEDGRDWLHAIAAAEVQIVFGEFAAVCAAMPAAIAAAQAAGDDEIACLAARRLATALAHRGRPAEAVAVLQERLPLVERALSPRARGEYLCELGTLLERADRRADGAARLREGIALALASGDQHTAATALVNLGVNRVYWGDAAAAAAAAAQGLQLRAALDGPGGLSAGFEMTMGGMLRDLGQYGRALEHLQRALQAFEADANALWVCNTRSHLALAWMHLGQWARARQTLQAPGDGVPPFLAARQRAIEALLDEAAGHPALPGLDQALALLGPDGRADIRLGIELERTRRLPASQSAAHCDALLPELQARELMGHVVAARACRALARLQTGQAAAAHDDALVVAAEAATLMPSGQFRPALWLAAAQVLRGCGDTVAAGATLARAGAWIAERLPQVPESFRESFRHRNAVVAALAFSTTGGDAAPTPPAVTLR